MQQKTGIQKAQEHFDVFYKPVYGRLWPSIRISLLTTQKYCALVNNFGNSDRAEDRLSQLGAVNILTLASEALKNTEDTKVELDNITDIEEGKHSNFTRDGRSGVEKPSSNDLKDEPDFSDNREEEALLTLLQYEKNTSLHNFVPTKTVYTQRQLNEMEEQKMSTYQPASVPINIIHEAPVAIPADLKVYAYERGNTSDFPSPKGDKQRKLDYFLMDCASVLPVIALDLQVSDTVLDLCTAPGGKALTIKQTDLPGSIVCNDVSWSRLSRLRNVLWSYIPESDMNDVTVKHNDGRLLKSPEFDKVLVDVPCNTDRHVLQQDDNNLFKTSRINERLELPTMQRDLLVAGIMSCVDGGSVVYSTCTLSPSQNDGVVQAALEYIWQETDINVSVVDLDYLARAFSDTFRFSKTCRFGQLVLPALSCNFGPMYICKLRKSNKAKIDS